MLKDEKNQLNNKATLPNKHKVNRTMLTEISFLLHKDLLYYKNTDNDKERLCISKSTKKYIFQLTHDDHSHAEFQRTYKRIMKMYYMRYLIK